MSSKPSAGKPADLVNEGLIAGQKIAKISVITLLSIGVVEIITGQISGSGVSEQNGRSKLRYCEIRVDPNFKHE